MKLCKTKKILFRNSAEIKLNCQNNCFFLTIFFFNFKQSCVKIVLKMYYLQGYTIWLYFCEGLCLDYFKILL